MFLTQKIAKVFPASSSTEWFESPELSLLYQSSDIEFISILTDATKSDSNKKTP